MVGGYIATFFTSAFAQELVSDLAKEDVSKYALKGKGFGAAFQNELSRSVDLKLWKSNLASVVAIVGGLSLTSFAVRKIEEHTFTKKHGELPRMDQVNQILKGEFQPEEKPKTNWQDKTKKADEVQQSISM